MTENTPDQIILGDLVQLKSGGPVMTVDSTVSGPGNKFLCCWFSEAHTPCAVQFEASSLVKKSLPCSLDREQE